MEDNIFTIGDRIFIPKINDSYTIDKFKIINNILYVYVKGLHYGLYLNECRKVKSPLFISEDGKEIFEGDEIYYIELNDEDNTWLVHSYTATHKAARFVKDISLKNFSTKEKAEEYILMNKPCLSLNDINKYYLNTCVPDCMLEHFEKLVKQRL